MASNVFINNTQVPNVVFTEVSDNLIVCNELKEEFFGISSLKLKNTNLLCEHFNTNEVKCNVKVGGKEFPDVTFNFIVDKYAEPKIAINLNTLPNARQLLSEQPVEFAQKLLNEQKKVLRLEEDIKKFKTGSGGTDLITEQHIQDEVRKQIRVLEEEFLSPQQPENKKKLADTIRDVILENESPLKNKILEDLKNYAENFSKNAVKRMQRYAEMMSGGGSVAMQFANGGTMKGDLTVTGKISASQIAGFAGGGLQPVNGVVSSTFPLSTLNTNVYITGTTGGYGLRVENRANFDPGESLTVDGRARVTHVMSFQAGIPLFTNGSDHSHVLWSTQSLRLWQMIQNGGPDFGSLQSQFSENQMFQLVTVGDNMGGTFFNELPADSNGIVQTNLHSIDTSGINTTPQTRTTFPYPASGIKLNFNTPSAQIGNVVRNLQVGEFAQLQFRIGFAGIVASTFPGVVTSGPTQVTIDGQTKFQYTFNITGLDNVHWLPAGVFFELNRPFGNAPGLRLLVNRAQVTGLQVGLSGNYNGVPRHVLVNQLNHNAFVGGPVVLSLGENLLGQTAGDYNAYVKEVIDNNNYVISVGNHYLFPNTSGTAGSVGWVVYIGSTDSIHQYNPGLQHFNFRRFRTRPDLRSTQYTGGNRSVALGNSSETDGYFTYALGYNSTILRTLNGPVLTASSAFGGSYSLVQGSYSTALGGNKLKITKDNQTVLGQFNDPNTEALIVVGNGTNEQNRTNAFELSASGVVKFPASAFQTVGPDTYLRILGPNNENYGIKLELLP